MLYTNRMQVVTTTATGIRSMADLKGKRIEPQEVGRELRVLVLLDLARSYLLVDDHLLAIWNKSCSATCE